MNVIITEQEGKTIAKIDGRIDTTNAKEFEAAVTPLISVNASDIVIDCAGLSYISSSGLRVFLIMQKSVNARKAKLALSNLSPAILEIFKVTGFASIFTIV